MCNTRKVVYRILSDVQRKSILNDGDVVAKNVNAVNSIKEQVEQDGKNSRWISFSSKISASLYYLLAKSPNAMIIAADLKDVDYVDISTKEKQKEAEVKLAGRWSNYPIKSRELVVEKRVSKEHILSIVTDCGEIVKAMSSVEYITKFRLETKLYLSNFTKTDKIRSLRNHLDYIILKNDYVIDEANISNVAAILVMLNELNEDWAATKYD